MSVKLNRPPKPEENQENFSTDKTIPHPGFEPSTIGSLNHCTIGLVCDLLLAL
jgi:hypothetical protein